MVTTGKQQCQAHNLRGEPCQAPAGPDGFCFWHSPAQEEARREARARGGRARHGRKLKVPSWGPVQLRGVAAVVGLLERACNDALALENSLMRARTLGYLAGAAVKALELSELTNRIEALEERFKV